jgi:hypothetical protein
MTTVTSNGVDLDGARAFLAAHGRLLDRRRFDTLFGADPSGVLAALDAYRNPDGGFGWGLEPDLRSPESQPTAAMHAFEVLAEIAPTASPRAVELCDWLDAHSRPDGGVPFAVPITDESGCAPWWRNPDTVTSNLQMTAQVAANAHLVARHDPAVANHPWLAKATEWCVDAIDALDEPPFAYELKFAMRFADALAAVEPAGRRLLDQLRAFLPANGVVPVRGGAAGEELRALDFVPSADGAAADLFDGAVLRGEVQRLGASQQPDGGWTVSFLSASPAAALEWRGYATVDALLRLRGYGAIT